MSRTASPPATSRATLAVPHNTMSAHLAILTRVGLIGAERQSRSIVYRAELARLRGLTLFLVNNCCGDRSELCAPMIADLTTCCHKEDA